MWGMENTVRISTPYLQSFPSVLLSSALCSAGYWSPSLRLAACAHTMKAFIGRFTCVRFLSILREKRRARFDCRSPFMLSIWRKKAIS